MASRRMFSQTVVRSSRFLRMPATSRLLYYDLGMEADDDGYCEWYPILQTNGGTQQDLEVLAANRFVKVFDDNVLVIKDWKENNYLRSDRYHPSKYLEVYKMTEIGIPTDNQMDTEVRLGKDRVRKGNNITISNEIGNQINEAIKLFGNLNPNYESLFARKTQRNAAERLLQKYGLEKLRQIIETAAVVNGEKFGPTITTPSQLEDKYAALAVFVNKNTKTKRGNYDD